MEFVDGSSRARSHAHVGCTAVPPVMLRVSYKYDTATAMSSQVPGLMSAVERILCSVYTSTAHVLEMLVSCSWSLGPTSCMARILT